MIPATDRLRSITHPLVSSVEMRKDFGPDHKTESVLVIETNFSAPEDDLSSFDSYLMDLLVDLEDLKNKAETYVGKFDRVDIRLH